MMTSFTGNIFHVTDRLWGESTGSPHKGQWRGALTFFLICAWTNDWANNRDAGDLIHHHARYYVTVTFLSKIGSSQYNLGIYSISILFKVEVLWHCRHVSYVRSNSGTVNHSLKSVIKGWGKWNTVKPLQVQRHRGPLEHVTTFSDILILIVNIKRSWDRLIFLVGIPTLPKRYGHM